jgi:hypothetical protein
LRCSISVTISANLFRLQTKSNLTLEEALHWLEAQGCAWSEDESGDDEADGGHDRKPKVGRLVHCVTMCSTGVQLRSRAQSVLLNDNLG